MGWPKFIVRVTVHPKRNLPALRECPSLLSGVGLRLLLILGAARLTLSLFEVRQSGSADFRLGGRSDGANRATLSAQRP
jgi:hypothetical protein